MSFWERATPQQFVQQGDYDALKAQRDALLAAAREMIAASQRPTTIRQQTARGALAAAIAKAEDRGT